MSTSLLRIMAAAALAVAAQGATVTANIYTGSLSGDGSPFTGLVGTETASDFLFFSDNGGNWHPFGLSAFAADITGDISVASDGNYALQYGSDDGSQLFIDGASVVNEPNDHGFGLGTFNTPLTAGLHAVEIHFYENGAGPSGVDLVLPSGVTVADAPSAPEPGTVLLSLSGLGLAWFSKRRR